MKSIWIPTEVQDQVKSQGLFYYLENSLNHEKQLAIEMLTL